jgi:hypothetical protein
VTTAARSAGLSMVSGDAGQAVGRSRGRVAVTTAAGDATMTGLGLGVLLGRGRGEPRTATRVSDTKLMDDGAAGLLHTGGERR